MSDYQAVAEHDEQTEAFRKQYNLHHINLGPTERILEVTSDHFMLVIPRLVGPAILGLIALGLALFRASGGRLLETGLPPGNPFDTVNILLLVLVGLIGLTWVLIPTGKDGKQRSYPSGAVTRTLMLAAALVLLGAFFFRAQGGQFFYMSPLVTRSFNIFFDVGNIILLAIAVFSVITAIYLYIEAENDHLILTTNRVILSDRQVFGTYKTDQINLEDIQDVTSKSQNYLEYYLRYGNIEVQSVRKKLPFPGAEEAADMQKKIMAQVKALRNQAHDEDYQAIIDTEIYKKPALTDRLPRKVQMPPPSNPPLLNLILPPNPEMKEDGTIIWRAHWLFLIRAILQPIAFLVVAFLAIIIASNLGFLSGLLSLLLGAVAVIIAIFWLLYKAEDHQNDLYILTNSEIIDVDKLPWGPEERRSARLNAIQNVSLETSLMSRWLGYGDVFLETAGAGKFTFPRVPYPREVVRVINFYQDEFKRGDERRTLKNVIELLKHYHSGQIREGELLHHPLDSNPAS